MVDLSFGQLLIWVIQKAGSIVFFGGKKAGWYNFSKKKRGETFFAT